MTKLDRPQRVGVDEARSGPRNFDLTDQAADRARGMDAAPADVRLLGKTDEGTWGDRAAEALDCRYKSASEDA